jgi:hypothetical protein
MIQDFSRQQKSFGQKRGKQCRPRAQAGHSNFFPKRRIRACEAAEKGCGPGFLCFARKGLERKEASLLTSPLVTLGLQIAIAIIHTIKNKQ